MKRFPVFTIPVVIIFLCFAGCPPPQQEDKREKPATPEEIRNQGQEILTAIDQLGKVSPQQLQAQVQQVRTKMRTFREKHSKTKEGAEMIQRISSKVHGNASRLFDRDEYQLCVVACDMVFDINPRHARTIELKKRAQEELAKPKVALKGFLHDHDSGKLIAWVDVTYQTTGLKETKQVELGEGFAQGYRFKKIIKSSAGKPIGIVLRWIKTGRDVELLLHPS